MSGNSRSTTTIKITVTIDNTSLSTLIAGKYSLCLVKDVILDGKLSQGNVIFATVLPNELRANTHIEWEKSYQVFETTQDIYHGEPIEYGTPNPQVEPGQKVIFYPENLFKIEGTSTPGDPIRVVNEWTDHARIGARCHNPSSTANDKFFPFYISPVRTYREASELNPVDSFAVFFYSYAKAGTMIELSLVPVANGRFRFLEGEVEGTVLYNDKMEKDKYWSAGKGVERLPE